MRPMKFVAAQKLMEIANAVEAVQDGRILIELINRPFLYDHKGARQNMARGSSSRSIAAGCGSTRAAPM
jgi:hypothetical protein